MDEKSLLTYSMRNESTIMHILMQKDLTWLGSPERWYLCSPHLVGEVFSTKPVLYKTCFVPMLEGPKKTLQILVFFERPELVIYR